MTRKNTTTLRTTPKRGWIIVSKASMIGAFFQSIFILYSYDENPKLLGGFQRRKTPQKCRKFSFAGSEKRGEKYVVVVSRESISIISISFITRKQNASLHKQQATHSEDYLPTCNLSIKLECIFSSFCN